jgi:hypothetical protein
MHRPPVPGRPSYFRPIFLHHQEVLCTETSHVVSPGPTLPVTPNQLFPPAAGRAAIVSTFSIIVAFKSPSSNLPTNLGPTSIKKKRIPRIRVESSGLPPEYLGSSTQYRNILSHHLALSTVYLNLLYRNRKQSPRFTTSVHQACSQTRRRSSPTSPSSPSSQTPEHDHTYHAT